MVKTSAIIALTLAFAGACGGKVVFAARADGGIGGAGGATSTSVGTCMTCDCMPQGCTDAATDVVATAGVGGGSTSSCFMTCAEALTEGGDLCPGAPGPAAISFAALVSCICDPSVCGGASGPCALTCAMNHITNEANCVPCEEASAMGTCFNEASACAAN